jgi:type VI secretion system protein ImpC
MGGPGNTRDRIRFNPSDRAEVSAPPLRLLVVADLAGGPAGFSSGRMRVDKDSFSEVLRTVCPRIILQIESGTAPSAAPVIVEFPVQDLKSFAPAQLLGAPFLRDLAEDRNAVTDLRDGRLSPEEFKRRVKSDVLRAAVDGMRRESGAPPPAISSQPPARSGGEDVLDSILSMVDTPAGSAPSPVSDGAARVQSFIADMFSGSRPASGIDRSKAVTAVRDVESILGLRMNEVLGNETFRRLESGWRGLKFLVDRTEFRDGIEIDLAPADKSGLAGTLETLLGDLDSGAPGYDAILAAFEFKNSPEDLEIVRRAAELAADLKAPLVASVTARFFGKESAAEVSRIPHLEAHLDAPEFVKWNSFREVESSRWIGVGFNRFLLRKKYDGQSARLAFSFEEKREGLWGNPVWAVGVLAGRSFSRTGWCGHISGVRGGGALEDLPLHDFELPSGDVRQIPLEMVFLRGREDDFYQAGFLALQCGEDQDLAALLDSPTAHRPEQYPDPRDSEHSRHRSRLSYQLVAARIARFVEQELSRAGGLGATEIQRQIERALLRFVSGAEGVQVQLAESQERVGYYDLSIRIRPGASICPLPASIDFSIPLRRN